MRGRVIRWLLGRLLFWAAVGPLAVASASFSAPSLARDPDTPKSAAVDDPAFLRAVRKELRDLVGPPPSSPHRPPVPPHLLKLYEDMRRRSSRLLPASPETAAPSSSAQRPSVVYDTVTSFYPLASHQRSDGGRELALGFALDGAREADAAELRFRCSQAPQSSKASTAPPPRTRVSLHQRVRNHSVLLDSQTLSCANASQEHLFSVTSTVQRWLGSSSGAVGQLSLEVAGPGLLSPSHSDGELAETSPYLVLYSGARAVEAKDHGRAKRSASRSRSRRRQAHRSSRRRGGWRRREQRRRLRAELARASAADSRRSLCGRRRMVVDMESIGWKDWIIAPPAYEAFACAGACPFPVVQRLNASNHAVVQSLFHSVEPERVPPSCCVPTELQDFSLLYFDQFGKVQLKNYPDMIVTACGCR